MGRSKIVDHFCKVGLFDPPDALWKRIALQNAARSGSHAISALETITESGFARSAISSSIQPAASRKPEKREPGLKSTPPGYRAGRYRGLSTKWASARASAAAETHSSGVVW